MNNYEFDWSICSDWANYVAMDADGKVWEFDNKPAIYTNVWSIVTGKVNILDVTYCNASNWHNSLIERPKQIEQPTTERHIHADLIIAWANGATIQYKRNATGKWIDVDSNPLWSNWTEYRIKPKSIKLKYKLAMMLTYNNIGYYVRAANDGSEESWLESDDQFVQWLTDWIEVEIEEK